MSTAITEYYNEVKSSTFPTEKHSFIMDESVLAELSK
jgi:ketopantoate hydroxymethyltransferase